MNNKGGRGKKKNVSYFSQEYIIANHGDIFSFVAMIFILGLMWKVTLPLASAFVMFGHNVTNNDTNTNSRFQKLFYTTGRRDICACFFYTVICIVLHAVVQEYCLDKLVKKFHLSKTKFSKFHESGQLLVFYLASVLWSVNIFMDNYVPNLNSLWEDYPNLPMPFWVKAFFIAQICYWLHSYPELYLQKVKREEMKPRVVYITLYLFSVIAVYVLNLSRLGLVLLTMNYIVEFVFHASRLLHFSNRKNLAAIGFITWDVLFVVARILHIVLAYLTFHSGLSKFDKPNVNIAEGNFNTAVIRMNGLVFIFITQAYMMWNFINFHLRKRNEEQAKVKSIDATRHMFGKKTKKVSGKRSAHVDDDEINDLPEVDQNQVRQRRGKK